MYGMVKENTSLSLKKTAANKLLLICLRKLSLTDLTQVTTTKVFSYPHAFYPINWVVGRIILHLPLPHA